jgi:TrpR-related protein YerC/YecD
MAERIENKLTDQLCEAVMTLKDKEECLHFLEDICTISEFKALAQRFEVARMLDEGEKYEDIVEQTGASTATISRVKRCLVYGEDGYTAVLGNMKSKNNETRSERVIKKAQFEKERAARKRELRKQ